MNNKYLYLTFLFSNFLFNVFSQIEISEGFESLNHNTQVSEAQLKSLGIDVAWSGGFDAQRVYIDSNFSFSGNNSMKVKYPAGAVKPGLAETSSTPQNSATSFL